MFETLPRLNGSATIEFIVNGESIIIELDGENAPVTAGNFVDLVERGIYDGAAFHRVEPGFVVQGGDPQSLDPNFPIENLGGGGFIDPDTGARRNIPLEIKLEGDDEPTYNTQLGRLAGVEPPPNVVLENDGGAIAMARSAEPDSASSQFYFVLEEASFLDGDYAVFGNVTEGLDVIDDIEIGDRIEDAEVTSGLENFAEAKISDPIDLYRFRNTNFSTGTYIFVSATERDNILEDPNLNNIFELEGDGEIAFKASRVAEDDLSPFYRLRSLDVEGTYLFVSEREYDNIFAEDSDQKDKWAQEGVDAAGDDIPDFYLYGAGTGEGQEFHRFRNNETNTYLFAGPTETANINSDPNLSAVFTDEGIAFGAIT